MRKQNERRLRGAGCLAVRCRQAVTVRRNCGRSLSTAGKPSQAGQEGVRTVGVQRQKKKQDESAAQKRREQIQIVQLNSASAAATAAAAAAATTTTTGTTTTTTTTTTRIRPSSYIATELRIKDQSLLLHTKPSGAPTPTQTHTPTLTHTLTHTHTHTRTHTNYTPNNARVRAKACNKCPGAQHKSVSVYRLGARAHLHQ